MQRSRTTLFLGSIAAVLYFSEELPYGIVRELVPMSGWGVPALLLLPKVKKDPVAATET